MNPQHNTSLVEYSYQQASSSRSQKNIPFFQSRVGTKVNFQTFATRSPCSDLQKESLTELTADARDKKVKLETDCQNSAGQVKRKTRNSKRVDEKEQSDSTGGDTCSDDRKRKLGEYYAKLRASGWILGTDGNWKKDETVEFDSDEDEPPPPPVVQ